MSERFTSSEWDVQPVNGAAASHASAAVWLWVIGALEIVVFSCLAMLFAAFGAMAWSEMEQTLAAQNMSDGMVEQSHSVHAHAGKLAVGMAVVGILPGLAYLVRGVLGRGGGGRAGMVASVLLLTQVVVVAAYGGLSVIGALASGQPGMVTMMVLVYGTPVALLVMALRSVRAANAAQRHGAGRDDSSGWVA